MLAGTFKGTENRFTLLKDQEATDVEEAALVVFETTFSTIGKHPIAQCIYILQSSGCVDSVDQGLCMNFASTGSLFWVPQCYAY